MKTIIALIQPTKLEPIREALERIEVHRMTVADAMGYLSRPGDPDRPAPRLARLIEIRVVVNDDFLDRTIDVIEAVGRTGFEGQDGDGKILVMPTLEAISLSDNSRGPGAV